MAFQNGSVGLSRLHIAAKFGHIQTCMEILGKNPENKNPLTNGISPLHLAAENGHFRICEMLLESGIDDKNPRGRLGLTPLHLAAREGHLDICKLFITELALRLKDSNPKCDKGWNPLQHAAIKKQGHICQYLKNFMNRPKIVLNRPIPQVIELDV